MSHRLVRRAASAGIVLAAAAPLACAAPRPAPAPRRVNLENVGRLPVFSHAAVAGRLVFVSGTLGTKAGRKEGSLELVPGGVRAETEQALDNVEAILAASGAGLRDVTKCTVYLIDAKDFPAMNEVWFRRFPSDPPARTTVGAAWLALGAQVEVDCVAVRPKG